MAKAVPSSGSVPAPISSIRTKQCGVTWDSIRTRFVIWPENVLSDCSMLCSSPISANISANTAISDSGAAGTNRPDCIISVNNPSVFRATVLPPVLGPVIRRVSNSPPICMSIGTTDAAGINGWRACRKFTRPGPAKNGLTPRMSRARRALANTKSSWARISQFDSMTSACEET